MVTKNKTFDRYHREVHTRGGNYKQLEVIDEIDNFRLFFDPAKGYIITNHAWGHGASEMDMRDIWFLLKQLVSKKVEP